MAGSSGLNTFGTGKNQLFRRLHRFATCMVQLVETRPVLADAKVFLVDLGMLRVVQPCTNIGV